MIKVLMILAVFTTITAGEEIAEQTGMLQEETKVRQIDVKPPENTLRTALGIEPPKQVMTVEKRIERLNNTLNDIEERQEKERQEQLDKLAEDQRKREEVAERKRQQELARERKKEREVMARAEAKAKEIEQQTVTTSSNSSALLSRLVEAEAKGESYAGKVAVAEVVLNRVQSDQFPNSIQGVVYQSGQFSPVSNGSINMPATNASKQAVNEAMSGTNHTGGALYFYNPQTASSRWLDGKPTKTVIGNHYFK